MKLWQLASQSSFTSNEMSKSNECKYCSTTDADANGAPLVPHISQFIDDMPNEHVFERLRKLSLQVRPSWTLPNVKYQLFPGSATNRLFGLSCEGDARKEIILFRVHGNQTELYIDRASEFRYTVALHRFGLTAHIFLRYTNGVAYEYLEGQVLDYELVSDTSVSDMIAREFARMHSVPRKFIESDDSPSNNVNSGAFLEYAMELFYKSIPEKYEDAEKQQRFADVFESRAALRAEIDEALVHIGKMKAPVVFCHNDLVMRNIILQPWASRVRFLDWEYAALNYAAFDIASHFVSFVGFDYADFSRYPNSAFRRRFLRTYLAECARFRRIAAASSDSDLPANLHINCTLHLCEHDEEADGDFVCEDELNRWCSHVQQFSVHVFLMWILWALVQMHISTLPVDFLDYAVRRFAEYRRVKAERLAYEASEADGEEAV